jgi:general secretion pathway protein J
MRRAAGFTLMEVMVALVVLGMLLGGLAQAVHFGLNAEARVSARLADQGRRTAVERALRRLIASAVPGQHSGHADRIDLITELPVAAADRMIEAAITVDQRHDLVLLWRDRRVGVPINPAPALTRTVLVRGIARIEIAYWWRKTPFGPPVWQTRGPAGGLPRLIRLGVVPLHGPPWPELIAGPTLVANGPAKAP